MNYRSFNLGDWIGHISGVIEDESTLDGNEMRDLVEFLTTLSQEPKTGHWVFVQRGKHVDVKCSECENVRLKEYAYNYTVDQVLADKENIAKLLVEGDMRHCPYCGTKMVETGKER